MDPTAPDSVVEAAVDVAAGLPAGTIEAAPHNDVQQIICAYTEGTLDEVQCLLAAAKVLGEKDALPEATLADWARLAALIGPSVIADVVKVGKLLAPLVASL